MAAHEDSLKSLAHLLGWSGRMADLEDELAEMCCDHDHWRRRAEEAETVLADAPGAGPSSRPLEEHLISPGGGSRSLGTIFGKMNINEPTVPTPSGSSLAGRLEEVEETMFPLLRWGEVPNRVSVLLDGTRYLHVQVP
ncbi:hypothetical protein SCLCIDRAFT_24430 [Scleroderma citrinum Foug A]|uniref:Uncharacterized protein n=1 Tax=Scleroderma citrinum Foug A TaxID=1036808 RepID=A0A0C3DRK6_9AGAM|nr:hypothetical protein SCLCIDRAFT_24430 [Scleroderma citrinum Foug A]